jgi:hypothetical protein
MMATRMLPETNIRLHNLPDAISGCRTDSEHPIVSHIQDGGQCRIFKADFSTGESWSIRVPIHVQAETQEDIIRLLEHEYDILQQLERCFHWAPKCRGSSFTFKNAVGFPFLALSWIEGSPLAWTSTSPLRYIRNLVIAQLARI